MNQPILLPTPDSILLDEGVYYIDTSSAIKSGVYGLEDTYYLKKIQNDIEILTGLSIPIDFLGKKSGIVFAWDHQMSKEGYRLTVNQEGIMIYASDKSGLYYGTQTFIQLVKNYGLAIPFMKIVDVPQLKKRGFFLDLTRGRVLEIEKIKNIIELASSLKFNQLQVYFEHTFAYSFFSEISVGKDAITSEDLREIDDYCYLHHIEMIPCIATFGHIFEVLKSDSFSYLCEYESFDNEPYSWMKRQLYHTIDCSDERSYELISRMLEEIAPLVRSEYINICGDETYDLGMGKTKVLADKMGKTDLYIGFLNKIIQKVDSLGKKAMFWGDVIINHPEVLDQIDQKAMCMYWQYEAKVPEHEVKAVSINRDAFYLCSASVGWNRLINDYRTSYDNLMDHGMYARKYHATGMVHTDWGDFGHINTFSATIPTLYIASNVMWAKTFKQSLSHYGEIVSMLHYGDHSKKLVECYFKASEAHVFTIEHLMKWYYEKYQNMIRYGSSTGHFTTYDEIQIREHEVCINQQIGQLLSLISKQTYHKVEVMEIVHMLKGVLWLLSFVKIVKEKVYNQNIEDLIIANDLAITMEEWFMRYETFWRKHSRESELYRIREVIQQLTHFLRTEIS